MEIKITTGELTVPIIRDDVTVGNLVFNPLDGDFATKFFALIDQSEATLTSYKQRVENLKGLPNDEKLAAVLELNKEACDFMKARIDELFSEGTSTMVFGSVSNPEVIIQFLDGLTSVVDNSRMTKVDQYLAKTKKTPRRRK